MAVSAAGCGFGGNQAQTTNNSTNNTASQRETIPDALTPAVTEADLYGYLTGNDWVNEASAESFKFKKKTFEGVLHGKSLKGKYTYEKDVKGLGKLILHVVLDGEKTEREYIANFQTAKKVFISLDDGQEEEYTAKE